jgi:hypothetical protein
MDTREAARRDRAAALVAAARAQSNVFDGLHVDDGEQIFTEDEDGIWVRGWLLVAMEELLPGVQKGIERDHLAVEENEQEIFVGRKGHFTGTWIRCWIRVPVDHGDMEDDEHGSD